MCGAHSLDNKIAKFLIFNYNIIMSENKALKTKKTLKNSFKTDFFGKMPFNYCDRWCERCDYKNGCEVYQEEFAARFSHIIKGENPDDPEVFFKDVKEKFKKIKKFLEKKIGKEGKNLKAVKKYADEEEYLDDKIELIVEKSHIHRETVIFTEKTNFFLKKIYFEYEESADGFEGMEKAIEELNWYYTFSLVKLHRALISQMKSKSAKDKEDAQFNFDDANCSAKLAYASLFVCHRSLKKFSQECLGFTKWARDLSFLSRSLLEKVETKFPQMNRAKIIFHA